MSEKPQVTETTSRGVTRRELLQVGNVLALPVLLGRLDANAMVASGPLKPGPEIYQSIGVEPIINCRGTFTIIGGSVARPEVVAAMEAASKYYVQMDELADGVGRRLAELTGAEWGMVTAGCAAALKLVTAACVAGGNPEKLHRIPDLADLEKTEVIIPRASHSAYDFAIQNVGVKIIRVDTPQQLEDALSPRTAMIKLSSSSLSLSPGPLGLEAVVKMAQPRNIPVLADAAAEVLTIPNVHLQRGATVVAYSGGKAICGPQCAGLLLGRKDLLMSAWQASAPHHGPGRDNKVGREETLGMLAAVEAWVTRDHAAEWKMWLSWLATISKRVSTIDSVRTEVNEPTDLNNRSPRLVVSWDPAKLHVTGEEVSKELANGRPRIALGAGESTSGTTSVSITAWMMQPNDEKVVADRLYGALSQKRQPRPEEMRSPAVDLSGRWEVDVEFFSSTSRHTLFIEQESNWIRGSHRADFSLRDLSGIVEGNQVTLRSAAARPTVTYIFVGTVLDDVISGPVYMGEFLNAKFTARRYRYPAERRRIAVPDGPPLSN